MSTFTVGFIGVGPTTDSHAERVQSLGHAVAAIAAVDPTTRQRFADEFDVDATFKEYDEMVGSLDLDAVMITVPNARHVECAVAALENGINVFVQKPLAHDVAAAERIARAEAASDATLMVGFSRSFERDVETLSAYLEDGQLGDVYEVNVEYVRRRGIPKLGSWFTDKEASGGGVVVDIVPSMLHLVMSLMEFPRVETISASTGANFGVKDDEYTYLDMWGGDPVDGRTFDVEDTMRAFARTDDGTTIHVNCAWASNSEPRQSIEVLGDEGGATFTPSEGLTVHTAAYGALAKQLVETPDRDRYEAEWEYFFDVLAGDREHTRNTVDEGVVVQKLVDAIYRSAENRREVELVADAEPVQAEK